jgi:small subunit ribosomal protein S8
MAQSDTIADLLTRLRNGSMAKQKYVEMYKSKLRMSILSILAEKGFVGRIDEKESSIVRVYLKYNRALEPVLNGLKRVSSPGRRQYVGVDEIPIIFGRMGIAILSTSAGVLDGKTAKEKNVGGELLCSIW